MGKKISQNNRDMITDDLLWFIRLRWLAVVGLVVVSLISTYIFPVLINPVPIYVCAFLLLMCNIAYYYLIPRKGSGRGITDVVLGMIQVEADIIILTVVLHFSGGVVNPFSLFYIFHVIVAAMILPRNLSYGVGITTILFYGLLAINELNGGGPLGYYPLKLSTLGGLWRNPVYALGGFIAFTFTVVLAQYLTRIIVIRMTAKHKNLEHDLRDRAEQIATINEMLKMTRVQMAQREKMVAIGQMATGIAHEIGNPLASISSIVQYLNRKMKSPEEKEQLLTIGYHIDRISGILKNMMNLSRPATGQYKWTDINELIDSTLSLVKFDKRMHRITIKNVQSSDLPMVWLNPQLFEQVLVNIFINAMDAIESKHNSKENILEIKKESDGSTVEIKIRDTGRGMNSQVARRAFESFFTTKEIGKGTGLGLFISYNLVSEIGGTIKLESEPDKGTLVIIKIPVRPQNDLISSGEDKTNIVV